jgi:hypothetical protein
MHKLNPVAKLGVDGTIEEYVSYDFKPAKGTKERSGKFYIVSCGQDDGDVDVSEFESEEAFVAEIDSNIEWILEGDYGTEENVSDWMIDAVQNAVGSGHLVRVSLWG